MDRKRGRDAPSKGSSSESSSNSPASPASPALDSGKPVGGANAFANDGSFMEMFKKKMEEERRKKEAEQAICPESTATAAADEGQSTVEKKTSSVASFVRGLAVALARDIISILADLITYSSAYISITQSTSKLQFVLRAAGRTVYPAF